MGRSEEIPDSDEKETLTGRWKQYFQVNEKEKKKKLE
jgi:hypothetical protein